MVTIIKNKPLINDVFEYDIILVGTNINNALGNGFQYQVKINFPVVEKINKETKYGDKRKLGTVKVINTTPIFCLLYINKGGYRPDVKPEFIDYEALEKCMKLINENFNGKRIGSTILGLSKYEGGGDREKIMDIIKRNSDNIELFLYDFTQDDYEKERNSRWKNIVSQIGKITTEEYRELKKEFFWRNAFGIFKPIPQGMTENELKAYIKKEKEGI
jgi:hypothetical protein